MKIPWNALGPNGRVRFARLRAAFWVALGIASFPLGWSSSVVLVWIASVYANSESAITSAEAADDEAVLAEICTLRTEVDSLRGDVRTVLALLDAQRRPDEHEHGSGGEQGEGDGEPGEG